MAAPADAAQPLPQRFRVRGKRPPLPHETAAALARPAVVEPVVAVGRGHQRVCAGMAGRPCMFARNGSGQAAQGSRQGRCVFCDSAAMAATLQTPRGRGGISRILSTWQAQAPAVFDAAFAQSSLTTLPEDALQRMRDAVLPAVAALLQRRQAISAKRTPEEEHAYQEDVAADRELVAKKMFPNRLRTIRHAGHQWKHPLPEELQGQVADVAPNDAGLPAAAVSAAAAAMEAWCKQGSWDYCGSCASVQPRHLKEAALRGSVKPIIRACKNCHKKDPKKLWAPQPDEVPQPLQGLNQAELEALRPLDVDCGPTWEADFGYYFHSAMIRLAWSADDVEDKIRCLERRSRKRAKKATRVEVVMLLLCLTLCLMQPVATRASFETLSGLCFPHGQR